VLTNEDLEKTREGGAAVSNLKIEGLEDGGGELALDPPGTPTAAQMEEASWRGRADAARSRLAEATAIVAGIEAKIVALREDRGVDDPMNPNRLQAREAEIASETEKLAAAQEVVTAARQALADLEEEARKAGVPPGWLRER
jgi:hypothetical protein